MSARGRKVLSVMVLFLLSPTVGAQGAAEPSKRFDGTVDFGGGTSLVIGGFLRVDAIYDFDAIGSEDSFNPQTIPTDGSDGSNTRFHAKWTRLNLDFRRPSRYGDARAFVETDFFSSGSSMRLRHGFAEVGPFLVGKTWSTFMDEDVIVPALDLEEPRAFIVSRRGMARWTQNPSEHWEWSVAIEDPDSNVDAPVGVSGDTEDPLPNLAARLRWDDGSKHFQVSAFAGEARFRADTGPKEDVSIWGLNLSGRLTVFDTDVIRAQLAYGPGIGSFRGGVVAAPDANNELDALDTLAATLSYQHYWRDDLWSHVVYSYGDVDNSAGQSDDAASEVEYAALNLVWDFAEGMSVGGEWLYGSREDADGASGDAHRLLFVFQMKFF